MPESCRLCLFPSCTETARLAQHFCDELCEAIGRNAPVFLHPTVLYVQVHRTIYCYVVEAMYTPYIHGLQRNTHPIFVVRNIPTAITLRRSCIYICPHHHRHELPQQWTVTNDSSYSHCFEDWEIPAGQLVQPVYHDRLDLVENAFSVMQSNVQGRRKHGHRHRASSGGHGGGAQSAVTTNRQAP